MEFMKVILYHKLFKNYIFFKYYTIIYFLGTEYRVLSHTKSKLSILKKH